MKLPTCLRELNYTVDKSYPHKFPTFINANDLKSFHTVKIEFEVKPDKETNKETDKQAPLSTGLLQFISDLPSTVTNLSIIDLSKFPESATSENEMSLKFPPNLEQLTLKIKEPISKLNLSILPSTLKKFKVTEFTTLSGQFPSTLEILVIDLDSSTLSFSEFWSRYLVPLPNLKRVKVTVNSTETIDFRGMEFPEYLHSLSLYASFGAVNERVGAIVLDGLPSKIEFLGLLTMPTSWKGGKSKYKIAVDGSKGETVESITGKLCLLPFKSLFKIYQL
ncbi:unnamed protein product [Ambrosiozyma monospora]|uniref:Unnamed protein product n=1 Tax=Ambrosiozyma monospora TaxID=43982 RepID=A0A9W6YUB3_AMBMO|nr:unnamed protein product [Ambrosiozyma monospora]